MHEFACTPGAWKIQSTSNTGDTRAHLHFRRLRYVKRKHTSTARSAVSPKQAHTCREPAASLGLWPPRAQLCWCLSCLGSADSSSVTIPAIASVAIQCTSTLLRSQTAMPLMPHCKFGRPANFTQSPKVASNRCSKLSPTLCSTHQHASLHLCKKVWNLTVEASVCKTSSSLHRQSRDDRKPRTVTAGTASLHALARSRIEAAEDCPGLAKATV